MTLPPLPRRNFKLRLGSYDVRVIWVRRLMDGDNALYGECEYSTRTIRLSRELNTDERTARDTLMHELLHLMYDLSGLRSSADENGGHDEEKVVSALTSWITMLMTGNKLFRPRQ